METDTVCYASVMPTYKNMHATPLQRFWDKILIDTNGCWLWQGATKADGYGTYRPNGGEKTQSVHRWSYEQFVAPIQDGDTIDHLCRVRNCCNPRHLEAVGFDVNMLRSRRTTCRNGHEYTAENSYQYPDKQGRWKRACRQCVRDAQKRYNDKKRQVD